MPLRARVKNGRQGHPRGRCHRRAPARMNRVELAPRALAQVRVVDEWRRHNRLAAPCSPTSSRTRSRCWSAVSSLESSSPPQFRGATLPPAAFALPRLLLRRRGRREGARGVAYVAWQRTTASVGHSACGSASTCHVASSRVRSRLLPSARWRVSGATPLLSQRLHRCAPGPRRQGASQLTVVSFRPT